jgi:hypothetical protein
MPAIPDDNKIMFTDNSTIYSVDFEDDIVDITTFDLEFDPTLTASDGTFSRWSVCIRRSALARILPALIEFAGGAGE